MTMAEIVNLNSRRKARTTAEAEARAAENRVRFGQTKAVKRKRAAETERAQSLLDAKRLED